MQFELALILVHLHLTVLCGYWRPRADERLGDPSLKVQQRAFSGQRLAWMTPRGPPLVVHCFCVCSGSALLGDLLAVI